MAGDCKVETALDILVGKWKPVILYHILGKGTLRFSELQRLIPDITKKMLTSQLRELEYHDIINRKIYAQIPPKVEYSLTEYGKGLMPLLESMHHWGLAHIKHLNEIYGEERAK
ncbi:helix-turn-helix domain-containing protein [Neobacillus niacini]|uniref:winged helix-turn-helix transcriptional regulator n=1 Tax=Neobacillus niacini TaxID=86668 RepID=UPI002FFDA0A0